MIKLSLFSGEECEKRLDSLNDPLVLLQKHINFGVIAQVIDQKVPRGNRTKGGRPPYPTELMIKVLFIQQYWNLSDDQTEFQIADRTSFQRFLGLRGSSQIPDAKTIWHFKNQLAKAEAGGLIFDHVERQLYAHGYWARGGQMVDASFVPVPKQAIDKDERRHIKETGEAPEHWTKNKKQQKDIEASWTKKHGKSTFGYKLSINVDAKYKLIRKMHISPAHESDQKHLAEILDDFNTSKDLYADRGYTYTDEIEKTGCRDQIQRRAAPNKPLGKRQKERNHRISKTRVRVEHAFAWFEQMGGKKLRTIGLMRACLQLNIKAALYNMRRLAWMLENGIEAF